ncbi:MAG: hypothetical protein FWD69_10005 [Polyangiaceae bacterium]|nr:hypothetical protein [Polyangiaceae bacterium]
MLTRDGEITHDEITFACTPYDALGGVEGDAGAVEVPRALRTFALENEAQLGDDDDGIRSWEQ